MKGALLGRVAACAIGCTIGGAMMAATMAPAAAQGADDFARMRAEIDALRADQARATARIAQLETTLGQAQAAAPDTPAPAPAAPLASFTGQVAANGGSAARPVNPAGGSSPGLVPAAGVSKLTLNGDLRTRYEANLSDNPARNRDRGVLRGRLRALYTFNPLLAVGGELSTGDANDPNSTDITLSGFDNDLDVSLSQAYIRLTPGDLTVFLGKIPQPFARTELVWDGDVNPEGVSASYRFRPNATTTVRANALYFLVDEAPTAADSRMIGGQIALDSMIADKVKIELAAGYYDYNLRSLLGADAGDFRTNRMANGRYLSDFNLLDVIGAVQFNQLGDRWPIRVVGDYVRNFGATGGSKSGFGIDLLAGRSAKRGDFRFGYGYAELGVDAVLAAFSHDNTNIGTNYRQHTFVGDYQALDNMTLNVTYYHYRPKDALFLQAGQLDDWHGRLRLNMLVTF